MDRSELTEEEKIALLKDLELTQEEFVVMPVKELNKKLKNMKIPKETSQRIKTFRRTLLNRGYANESRNKKLSGDEKTELENRALEAETAATLEEFDHVQFVEVKSLDKREQKLKQEIEDLKRYYLEHCDRPDLNFSDLSDISSDDDKNSGEPFKKYRYQEDAVYKDHNHELTKKINQFKKTKIEADNQIQKVTISHTHILDEEKAELLAHLEKYSDEEEEKIQASEIYTKNIVHGTEKEEFDYISSVDDQNTIKSISRNAQPQEMSTKIAESGNSRMTAAAMNFGLQEGTAVVGPSVLSFKARLNDFRKYRRELSLDQWLKMKQEPEMLEDKKKTSNWQTNEDEGRSIKSDEDTDAMDRAIHRSLSHEES